MTGTVVQGLVLGLPAYVLIKILTPNFFARKDTRTPVYTASASLVVTVGLNIALVPRIGMLGLAVAGSVGAWCNVALLYLILRSKGHYRMSMFTASRVVRMILAAAIMGAGLWWLMDRIDSWFTGSVTDKALGILAVMGLGITLYGVAAVAVGVLNRATITRLMRRAG